MAGLSEVEGLYFVNPNPMVGADCKNGAFIGRCP